ncbi:MAG: alpha-amylase family glycosyl hydrolase [Rubricoccaceae bacterium]
MRLLPLFVLLLPAALAAQPFSPAERAQGYALRGDTTHFVFDAGRYGTAPARVVVTGGFRQWSTSMDDPAWQLAPLRAAGAELWTLAVANAGYAAIPPATPFKFRVDDAAGPGRWLDPPADAPNVLGGNLVFLFGTEPPRLRAELRGPRAVWARVSGDDVTRPLRPDAYRLVRADGTAIPVAAVLPNEAETALVVPAEDLDVRRVHYLFARTEAGELRAMTSFDGLWRTLYSAKPLGAEIVDRTPGAAQPTLGTDFRLFAPRADSVRLHFYAAHDGPETASHALARDADGVWEVALSGDLHGTWYDFSVYGPDDPGNTFTNHTGRRVRDPYARVVAGSFGRGRVWRPTRPATGVRGGRPAMQDLVAYEVHVQDFTDNLPLPDELRGTLSGMATPGLRNSRGEPIGLDHLERLGINAVHLLPVQEFLHYPDDVWRAAFADDPFMREQGIADENYQWGYRITDFFAVENRYRRRGTEHGAERDQFRDLVQAFHDRGIAVIVDFVFNHTGENMEGLDHVFSFNGIDRHYYYRLDQEGRNIGPYGNEVKSEERPMVQRWLIDQMRHYMDEFGVDGFRIDLAGATDEQTLRAIRAALPETTLIYGEPWIPPSDPDVVANPSWAWYKEDAPITFFQDDARNSFKGPVSTPRDPVADRGFAGGDGTQRARVKHGLASTFPEETSPLSGINYLDIHDNWALADQFARFTDGPGAWDGRAGVDEAGVRIAATLLLTSLGPVVLHGGTEFLRSKGLAPHPDTLGGERVLRTAMGPVYLKGRGDTYNLRAANRFDWERVGATPADGVANDYAAMLAWWRGLIALRRSEAGAVFRQAEAVPEGYFRWFEPADARALGYLVGDRVLVLVNGADAPVTFEGIPDTGWTVVAESDAETGRIDVQNGLRALTPGLREGAARAETLPARGIQIWVRSQ